MLRILVFLIFLYIIVKMLRIITRWQQDTKTRKRTNVDVNMPKEPPRFEDIQDADFEDITPKPPNPSPPQSTPDR